MPPSISIDHNQYRNDSTVKPRVVIAGYAETPYIKLHNWQYFIATGDSILIEPNNRSMLECPIYLRDCFYDEPNWTLDTPDADFNITTVPLTRGFIRNGTEGGSWRGAYYDIPLDGDIVTIQATAKSITLSSGISLQDSDNPSHNYLDNLIPHSMIFGQNGQLSIREFGVIPASLAAQFKYEVGDIAMIELDKVKNVVRYYLIKGEEMFLLRTTRPKLSTDPVAEMMLFFTNASLDEVVICNMEAEASDTFENIAVTVREVNKQAWQAWNNQRNRVSNADPIQLADGEFEYTFPSSKQVLRQLGLTPRSYSNEGFQNMEDFFNWHGNEKEFIFVDEARKDSQGNPQEFWARFSAPITDQSSNGCLFAYNSQIIEAYRGDYVPRLLDVTNPSAVLGDDYGGMGVAAFDGVASDDVGVKYYKVFVDGVHYTVEAEEFFLNGTTNFTVSVDTSLYSAGVHNVYVKLYDYADNEGTSNTKTFTV